MDLLTSGLGWADAGLLVNRSAVGVFFAISGYHKLTNEDRRRPSSGHP
jgi:uncharacterized membrane protein YphA (DoxX/SURF4 family)